MDVEYIVQMLQLLNGNVRIFNRNLDGTSEDAGTRIVKPR